MTQSPRDARMAAALAALGFQRVDASPLPSEVVQVGPDLLKVAAERPSMGTLVSITVLSPSRDRAEEAVGRAFAEMNRVVDLLNRYDDRSALSYLNAEGTMADAPEELTQVMEAAVHHHSASQGSFDVTVRPLVDLLRMRGLDRVGYGNGASGGGGGLDPGGPPSGKIDLGSVEPSDTELAEALSLVDGSAVELAPRSVRFTRPHMSATLDGIAKGYVVDRMAQVLGRHGVSDFLINAGGDIRTSGSREDGQPWRIGVQDPEKEGRLPDVIELQGAVATSGSYEIFFNRERSWHHIVSADDGRSPTHLQSVSVVAPTAMTADALATTVFVMGPQRGIPFIDSLPQCAALLVDTQGTQWRSTRWRSSLPPDRKEGQT